MDKNMMHREALARVREELEEWNCSNSPSESGVLVENVPAGHPLHVAVTQLQWHYEGRTLPRPAITYWRSFLRYARSDNQTADDMADRLLEWVKREEVRVTCEMQKGNTETVVVETIGDLWKAWSEGCAVGYTVSSISMRPNRNLPSVWHEGEADERKRLTLDRATALVRQLGGSKAEALDQLIAELQLKRGLDHQTVLRMTLTEFLQAYDDKDNDILDIVLRDLNQLHREGISEAEASVLRQCLATASTVPDYIKNPVGKKLFHAVLVITVRFLKSRLDVTQGHDPSVAYLFRSADGSLPLESSLQQDYFRFAQSYSLPDCEISNVGGGRADLRFVSQNERIVIEVKRETGSNSFESLRASYSAQAMEYQKTSLRIGFLLVLDLSDEYASGVPHITELVSCDLITAGSENGQRCLVTVKVPGQRLRPSEM